MKCETCNECVGWPVADRAFYCYVIFKVDVSDFNRILKNWEVKFRRILSSELFCFRHIFWESHDEETDLPFSLQ